MIRLTLKPGREASVLRRHPWVFSGAVADAVGDGSDGVAEVVDAGGRFLARGAFSPDSQIVARLWTFEDREIGAALFRERFTRARALRDRVVPAGTTGYRWIHSEGDLCPGLILDRYGETAVLDLLTGGVETWEADLAEAVRDVFAPSRLHVRRSAAEHDRLSPVRAGAAAAGRETPASDLAPFTEYNIKLVADVAGGQKTGFFLDQRENRARLAALAAGRTVLNLFSYSGAFSTAALTSGARRAVDVDASEAALQLGAEIRRRNGLSADPADFVRADVFDDLRRRTEAGEQWDIVISDPPPFARKRADVERAARGYKDVNRLAMKLVAPGGLLLTCSCSGLVDANLFQKIVFAAGLEAQRSFALVARQGAGADHPVSLECPEGEYLKGLWLERQDG
ncbi:MAG TPA: class I SAM-dependent rRNA methyltransferase [Thermoanaerobaculia bacterium]|nr:class I SAM-dependent rRNA methyltransferase [Thermoanaerobaculia bacterium]